MIEKIREKLVSKNKIIENVIVISILILALFLRCYELGEIPKGIHIDEAGMAYDAFCLGNFGVDRYLNKLPVYLINYAGGQSALYAYLAMIFIRFLGIKTFVFRIPAVIMSMCSIIAIYLIGKKFLGNKSAILLLMLITINPWNIMASRWGLDCNLLAPCTILSICLLFKAVDGKWYNYLIAGTMIGITLYSYAISYIIMPIFLLMIIIYMLYTKKITLKNVLILGIPIFILALPLMIMMLVNNGVINEINSFITIPKLFGFRVSEISIGNVFENIKRIPKLFSFDGLTYNSVKEYGTVYYFTIPLIIVGIIVEAYNMCVNIKEKKFSINTGIFLFFISVLVCFFLLTDPNINRTNAIYFPLVFFQYSAIRFLYKKLNKKTFNIVAVILMILYGTHIVSFANYYFKEYPIENKYQYYFEDDLINAIATTIGREELASKKVNIITKTDEVYIYTLLVEKISPYDFNKQKNEKNEWGRYVYYLEEIHDDMVYVISKDYDCFVQRLLEKGFKNFFIGNYQIVYKD